MATPAPRVSEGKRLAALLEAQLLADFFAGPGGRAGSSLATGALIQAVSALAVGSLLYLGLAPFPFLVAGFAFVGVVTVLVVGPETSDLLRNSAEPTVGALPCARRTLRLAGVLRAALYLVLATAGAAIPISVLAGAAGGSAWLGVATFGAALHQSFFFAAATAGLESLLARHPVTARLRALVSFAVGVLLVGAVFLGIRPLPEIARLVEDLGPVLLFFPPAWFATEALAISGAAPAPPELVAAAAAGTIVAILLGSVAAFGPLAAAAAPARGAGVARRAFARAFVRPSERATFDFTLDTLPREGERALRAGPIFAFPAALLLVGATLDDPDERGLFVHLLLFVASAYLPAAIHLLAHSPHAAARWIFDVAPLRHPESLRAGVRKATLLATAIPLVCTLEVADVLVRGPATAALHAPIVLLVAMLVVDRAVGQLADPFPFGETSGRLQGVAGEGAIGLGFGLTLFGFVEHTIVRGPGTAALVAAPLAALVIGLPVLRRRDGGAAVPA